MFDNFRQAILGKVLSGALNSVGQTGGFAKALEQRRQMPTQGKRTPTQMSQSMRSASIPKGREVQQGQARQGFAGMPRNAMPIPPRIRPQQQNQIQDVISPLLRGVFLQAALSQAGRNATRMVKSPRTVQARGRVLGANTGSVESDIARMQGRNKSASEAFKKKPTKKTEEPGFLQFLKALFGLS